MSFVLWRYINEKKRERERELVTVEINGNSLYSLSIFISDYDWTVNSPPRFQ